ncbi:dTMP kinase [Pleionea sediminis]|uniref:dTMP kinase n=1 Tax=Pleionea sediminis TaxID=2569479 RepID=UPI0011872A76|nr:dTMP kinase [Pleionea sediminis]
MQPQFITIEGGEGVGKTTNLQLIESLLKQNRIDFIVTREPGGTPFAEEIRELLLNKRQEAVDPVAELLLVFAARKQHVEQTIKPALASGQWVVCDRFTDATFAYQGGGRELGFELIEQINQLALAGFKPNKTLLLDVDPDIGMQRAAKRSELDRFESEQMAFFERVRAAYRQRASDDAERFMVVDAGQDLVNVQTDITTVFQEYIDGVTHD